jgi:PTH1 family peptidyl-tRNA hydrolase
MSENKENRKEWRADTGMFLFKKKKEEIPPMYVIAGLGNPTARFEKTRHNAGFDVIDVLAEKYNIKVTEHKHKALCGAGYIEGQKVVLVKPQTFMNLSGESIAAFLNFYKLDASSQLIVIYDDITLAPGRLRVRMRGSAGGHNGMKNIIERIKTQDFMRIRVGIGEKPQGWDLADYVTSRFSKEERKEVEAAMELAADAAVLMVNHKAEEAMNRYNGK